MSTYEDYAYKKARTGILAIKPKIAEDIYALSFYYSADDDDPRKAVLAVGYNTNAHCLKCTPKPGQGPKWPIASDADEARWNYAFWLQHRGQACEIGSKTDVKARKAWIESLGCWWTDAEQKEDFDRTLELGDKIMNQLIKIAIAVAKRLHKDGVITKKFGRPIPILVHELEYYDEISEATRMANPKGLTKDFEKWIEAM